MRTKLRGTLSKVKRDIALILSVLVILFVISNIFSHYIIKSYVGVGVYEDSYLETKRVYLMDENAAQYVHPFFGLANVRAIKLESELSDEPMFSNVDHVGSNRGPKILILGGSVAANLSNNGSLDPDQIFSKVLSKHYPDEHFSIYNAAFGGGKQPQQYFKLLYLDLLGYSPDLVVNLDGFNEIALSNSENFENQIPAIFPRSFNRSVSATAADRSCAKTSNVFASHNTLTPLIELVSWYVIRSCHVAITGSTVPPYWSETLVTEDVIAQRSEDIWIQSSNKIHVFLSNTTTPYIHVLQPNQHLVGSKKLSKDDEREKFAYYGNAIQAYYGNLDISKIMNENFTDLRYLFETTEETLYRDSCCHLNNQGIKLVSNSMIEKNKALFDRLFKRSSAGMKIH